MRIHVIAALTFITTLSFGQADNSKNIKGTRPFVLGLVDEMQSVLLAEKRVLNIYLPEGYNANDTVTYPVVYLLDGSADEDFIHVAGLYQFNNFSWINRVPKSIVVGIATVDRRRDFTFPTSIAADQKRYPTSGHSDKFSGFIEKELQPYIRRKYKGSLSSTIIGQSLGGLFATEVLLKKPTLFSKYIIISPSLWWDDGSLLRMPSAMMDTTFGSRIDVYIGVGKEGLSPGDIPHVSEVDANLLAEKLKTSAGKGVRVCFDYLPGEDHATVSHQAIFNALRLLFSAGDKRQD